MVWRTFQVGLLSLACALACRPGDDNDTDVTTSGGASSSGAAAGAGGDPGAGGAGADGSGGVAGSGAGGAGADHGAGGSGAEGTGAGGTAGTGDGGSGGAGADGSGGSDPDLPGDATAFCATYATRICEVYQPCNCPPADTNVCVATWQTRCQVFAEGEVAAGRSFVEESGQRCLERVALHVQDCAIVDPTELLPEPWNCELFRGSVPLGGECLVNEDCAEPEQGEALCELSGGGGTCIQTRTAGVGDECDRNSFGALCERGLFCDSTTGTCAEPAALGEACAFQGDDGKASCAGGNFCSPSSGECTAPAGVDESCEPYFIRNTCEPGLACDALVGVCAPAAVVDTARCDLDD